MPETATSSLHRRSLAEQLKALRERAGLSGRELARELSWSQSKVSRGERGETMLPLSDIVLWLQRCNASKEESRALIEIAEEASVEAVAIQRLNRWGHGAHQRNRIEDERTAQSIAVYQCEVVPGLFQTPDYIRELLLLIGSATVETVSDSVAARLERQAAVTEAKVPIDALITEPALRFEPGSAQVASEQQLDRLLSLLDNEQVTLGIISFEAMRRAYPSPAFTLLRWEDQTRVDTELLHAESTSTEPSHVEIYEQTFARLRDLAVFGPQAAEIIRRARGSAD